LPSIDDLRDHPIVTFDEVPYPESGGVAPGKEVYKGTVFSCKDPGYLGTRGSADGHPSWIVSPLLAPDFESNPLGSGVTRVVLLTLGLVWLFVLSMIIVRQEEGDLRWATIKRRLRLNTPREPTTGQPRPRALVVGGAVPCCCRGL
jgi:hypothetical protein